MTIGGPWTIRHMYCTGAPVEHLAVDRSSPYCRRVHKAAVRIEKESCCIQIRILRIRGQTIGIDRIYFELRFPIEYETS